MSERCSIKITGGKIRTLGPDISAGLFARTIDADGKMVTPGLIDCWSTLGLDPGGPATPNGTARAVDAFDGPCYLFGAHIFSQYLLGFGLEEDRFEAVLDNGPAKTGRRLYGTNLVTRRPEILEGVPRALVALRAGVYDHEIKQGILQAINENVVFM